MRYALALFVILAAACGSADTSSDAGTLVTELPDGAACPSGEMFCGGTACIPRTGGRNCGACGNRCPASAPACIERNGAFTCEP